MMTTARKPSVQVSGSTVPADLPEPSHCNVPSCPHEPTTRGLCDAHWSTHRGKADPLPEAEQAIGQTGALP